MSLSLGHSLWLLLLCTVGAGVLTFWAYRHTVPPVSTGRRLLLGGLRFGALFLVLFLLFEPVLRRFDRSEEPPVLAVLIDDSQSLRVTGGSGDDTTAADPRPAVQEALRRLERAGLEGEARFFSFSRAVEALPDEAAPDSLHFEGPRTDMAAALEGVRAALREENLRGIILLSDGQYNTGRNPLYVAERSPVPIHTVVLGDTTRRRDVQIRRVTTNEIAYVDTELPVQISLRAEDVGEEGVQVSLFEGGERLSTARVTLPAGTAEVPVDLSYTPSSEGLKRLTAAVTRLDGEATYRNNTQAFTVRVLESKRRLLLLGAAPSPDVAAVRQLLEQDPNAEVEARIPRGNGAFYEGPLQEDLSALDALVLAGFPGPSVPEEAVRRVAEAAEAGTPVFFLLTRQTDLEALGRHFAEVLPAAPDAAREGFVETAFVPTERGLQHPVFDIPQAAPALWRQLPPLWASPTRWQLSPDAQVLATSAVRGIELDDPLLAVRQRAGQRAVVLLGAGTWRWKNVPEDLEAAGALWPALFSNLVQWVTTREDDRPVRVEPVAETFGGGEPVEFTGQVYNESLEPVSDASLELVITGPDGARYPHQMEALGNGRYVARIGTLPGGTYRYAATAERSGDSLGTDRGAFAVGALALEFRETRADAALMRQIAARSGGTFYGAEEVEALPARLAASGTFAPLVVEEERDTKLWQLYGFLIAAILLLAAEWFLRKRSGMV